ncbi:hypothetical protein [Methylobacterium sp. AMS5]|uniref:hypothetical protein n=1 Tax=Methylobacterium sp. AMS5 TaxID=925818 RepID=UPI00074F8F06|nr:hypothetical protein [Methylobacterium sp. AMS5]AMB48333.1 hypothetical protein Y590_25530 [Methylobacterium sp. AMS5]
MPSGHVIIIHPDNRVTVEDTLDGEPYLGQLQKAVDGYIEPVASFDTIELDIALLTYADEASVRKLMPQPIITEPQACRCFCNEDGKVEGRPVNMIATKLWASAMLRSGLVTRQPNGLVAMSDVLVGSVALLIGDAAIKHWERPE